jgi:hypothetical protein
VFPASIDKAIDNAPLKDILDILSDRYGLTFIINAQAFDQDLGLRNLEDHMVRLPRMPGVTLQTVLRHLLSQVQSTVLVRHDHLELVPPLRARCEAYGNKDPGLLWKAGGRVGQPLVSVVCEQRRLDSVLADIARQAGCNVVLDARVSGREDLVVTASLLNAPTDTAVRVLAELANLKSVQMDNVFFVTTRELAAELQREEDKRAEARAREIPEPKASPAPPNGSGPPKP